MAAHLPRLPVLLFVFLAAHVFSTSTHAAPPLPSTYDVSMCSESSWCGDVEISYPFYLANATEATADYSGNYSCGYTDLSVSCKLEVDGRTWTPTIRLGGDDYAVDNISYGYGHQTISLADNDVLGGGDCPIVRHNVSFNETWLFNTSAFDNLTFFSGCHWGPSDTPRQFADYQISCAGTPDISGVGPFVFKAEDIDEHAEQELASHCDKIFSVPVRSEALGSNTNLNLTGDGYGKVLRQGFELEWNRTSEDHCGLCEGPGSGGRCAYSQKREFLGCLCNGGKAGSPDCKRPSMRVPCLPRANAEFLARSLDWGLPGSWEFWLLFASLDKDAFSLATLMSKIHPAALAVLHEQKSFCIAPLSVWPGSHCQTETFGRVGRL